jgi:integrase
MPPVPRTPSLRRHKPSEQGVVTLNGKDHYLGRWPAAAKRPPEPVRLAYDRLIAEWPANGRRQPQPDAIPSVSVNELILAFWRHAEQHYRRDDGTATNELGEFRYSLRPLRELYGAAPAAEFSPLKLKAVRQRMIDAGLCRGLINKRVGRVVRMFKWAVSEEIIPEPTYRALTTVRGLEKGRTEARETEPVQPVADADVDAVLPFVLPPVAAMIQLQRLTGARPGEVCLMRACDLDMAGEIWLYRPRRHKTQHRGKARLITLGPRAQAVLRPFLRVRCPHCLAEGVPAALGWREGACGPCRDRADEGGKLPAGEPSGPAGDYYLFSPAEGLAAKRAAMRAARKTKVQPSQRGRRKRKPKRAPGDHYSAAAYDCAIAKACKKAGVPHWHPHRLRHSHATEVRKRFGLEAAQVALGHAQANVTEVYAERDLALAVKVAAEIG